ncbi:MAG: dicarboxylate/amino acid:cation symporter [Alphaproteobacteria bacterium]|nr:dicarboxylate/amino acid:cation symporter [Alphaproteobacteria bacterium]
MDNFLVTLWDSLKQRSIQTILFLVAYVLIAPYLPREIHEGLYTISLFMKDTLIWIMPLTVGFFIAYTVNSFERQAPLFVLVLLIFETCSNFSSVWYAFGSATFAADYLPLIKATSLESDFNALWRIPFDRPRWWSTEKGAFIGLVLGIFSAFTKGSQLKIFLKKGKNTVEWILTRVFAQLIPIFVLGFAAHMIQTKLLDHVMTHYAVLVMWLTAFLFVYLIFLFFLGAGFSVTRILSNIKNMLPAGGMALTSSCSMSTMPWTIEGSAKNLHNPLLAKAIIPATTNIQQIGDCFANTFLCFLIYRHFFGHNPDMMTWLLFSSVFVLARFATAAVLGGAIFIMLPIYESYLNFTPEMIAIILALNVVLDPLITSCNVMANGALCRVFERIWAMIQTLLPSSSLTKAPSPLGKGLPDHSGVSYELIAKTDLP